MRKAAYWIIAFLVVFDTVGIILLWQGVTLYSFKEKPLSVDNLFPLPKAVRMPQKLEKVAVKTISAGAGVKSLLADPSFRLVYAFNLEGMSVYEYTMQTGKLRQKLVFEPTEGEGYDYTKRKWYSTYQEKPVEGCFTHKGQFLWISLHNAEGVVVWDRQQSHPIEPGNKRAYLINAATNDTQTIGLPFFPTGKTPKVMSATADNRFVFVANWHSNSITVINTEGEDPTKWKVINTLETGAVPRGNLTITERNELWVGHMGSRTIGVYQENAGNFKPDTLLKVGYTPRHLVYRAPYVYVSLSSPEKILKIDAFTRSIIRETVTADDPRTIALSPDGALLFVTCYADEVVQVYRTHDLHLLGGWTSKGKPVGIVVRQPLPNTYEAWVCNYTGASINVFTFRVP